MSSLPGQDPSVFKPSAVANAIIQNIEKVLIGKRQQVELALATVVAGGHLLLEDVPGSGKTMLARALSASIGLSFKRIQFTADLMPSDIVGGPIYNPKDGSFVLRPGPIFANLVLADEVNRANPRAQSALLESMEEAQITLDGQTVALPAPFAVLATQNPIEMAGTYPLPEAQLDRFLTRIALGYPNLATETGLIAVQQFAHPIHSLKPVCNPVQFAELIKRSKQVTITAEVAHFIASIVHATRSEPRVKYGSSPRGTLGLARLSRALSCMRGLDYVDPSVVRELAVPVLAHRIVLRKHGTQTVTQADVILDVLRSQRTPQ